MPRVLHLGGLRKGASQRLFIATPVMDSPDPEYVHSILQTQLALFAAGIEMDWTLLVGECHVDDARNFLVREFLESACTDLLFIDADEGWSPVELVKLAGWDCDVVAGVLPRKADTDEGYPVRLLPGEITTDSRGLIEVEGVGTGFMRIRRNVLEQMYEAEPRKHRDKLNEDQKHQIPILFERDYVDSLRLSGDYAFCRKWRKLGGKIFIDPDMGFAHVGTKVWTGHLGRYLCQKENLLTPKFCAAFKRIQSGKWTFADFEQIYAEWNNPFSLDPKGAAALFEVARTTVGHILETGSGLSTLLFAAAGAGVFSLEHELSWVQRMKTAVVQLGLGDKVELHYAPLREYKSGNIWYTIDTVLPDHVGLVFCDGPQRAWGRDGIFEILGHFDAAPFIFDDANDEELLSKVEAWAKGRGRSVQVVGEGRKLAVVTPLAEVREAAE